jgi:hypothetical protein
MKNTFYSNQNRKRTQWLFQSFIWGLFSCVGISMASDLEDQKLKERTVIQGQMDGENALKDLHQEFNNDFSTHEHKHEHHHRNYIVKITTDEDSELDTVSTVISESDIKVLEKISEEEQEKRLIDALRRKKKSNKVYQGESYDFGTTSTSSGVVISSGISFKKK